MKRFKLVFLLVGTLFLLDSCRLVSRIKTSLFRDTTEESSQFDNKEIEMLISAAQSYQGVGYRVGGDDENGMDCSGLLFRIYSDNNYSIPRVTNQQASFGLPGTLSKIQKGDWLFFKTNGSLNINHVGLVTKVKGPNEVLFIHASTTKGVREDNLYSNYWFRAFQKVIRPYKNNSN